MSEVLSQEEIDALLEGVRNGDVEVGHHISDPDAEIKEFDLDAKEKITRGRLPSLEMINDRFARRLGISLFSIIKQAVDVKSCDLRMQKFGEYISGLASPSNINSVSITQLDATSLVVMSRPMVDWLVDLYFGGSARPTEGEPRATFTPTEIRLVKKVLDLIFTDLKAAWEPVAALDFSYRGSESNPRFASFFSPSEIVLVSEFKVIGEPGGEEGEEPEYGRLDLMLPFSALEPFKEALDSGLQSDQAEKHQRWKAALTDRLENATVELRSEIAKSKMKLRELSRLRPGDIIPIEMSKEILVKAKDTPSVYWSFWYPQGCKCHPGIGTNSKRPRGGFAS